MFKGLPKRGVSTSLSSVDPSSASALPSSSTSTTPLSSSSHTASILHTNQILPLQRPSSFQPRPTVRTPQPVLPVQEPPAAINHVDDGFGSDPFDNEPFPDDFMNLLDEMESQAITATQPEFKLVENQSIYGTQSSQSVTGKSGSVFKGLAKLGESRRTDGPQSAPKNDLVAASSFSNQKLQTSFTAAHYAPQPKSIVQTQKSAPKRTLPPPPTEDIHSQSAPANSAVLSFWGRKLNASVSPAPPTRDFEAKAAPSVFPVQRPDSTALPQFAQKREVLNEESPTAGISSTKPLVNNDVALSAQNPSASQGPFTFSGLSQLSSLRPGRVNSQKLEHPVTTSRTATSIDPTSSQIQTLRPTSTISSSSSVAKIREFAAKTPSAPGPDPLKVEARLSRPPTNTSMTTVPPLSGSQPPRPPMEMRTPVPKFPAARKPLTSPHKALQNALSKKEQTPNPGFSSSRPSMTAYRTPNNINSALNNMNSVTSSRGLSTTPAPVLRENKTTNASPQLFPFPSEFGKQAQPQQRVVAVHSDKRIPGPAGDLPDMFDPGAMEASPSVPSKRSHDDTSSSSTPRFTSKRPKRNALPSDVSNDPDFGMPSWQTMCEMLQRKEAELVPVKDIVLSPPFTKICGAVGIVHEIKLSDSGANVVLKDPTGCIPGVIHRKVVEKYPDIPLGTTIYLKQVSIFKTHPRGYLSEHHHQQYWGNDIA